MDKIWTQEPGLYCRWQSELSHAKFSSFFPACLPPFDKHLDKEDQASGTKLWVNLHLFCGWEL
jgi:hypothetical protein